MVSPATNNALLCEGTGTQDKCLPDVIYRREERRSQSRVRPEADSVWEGRGISVCLLPFTAGPQSHSWTVSSEVLSSAVAGLHGQEREGATSPTSQAEKDGFPSSCRQVPGAM